MPSSTQLKYCPGLIHLRAQLRKLVAATGATEIKIDDPESEDFAEDFTKFGVSEDQIIAASEYATEVDAPLYYIVGDASLCVIYDGPYSDDNAAEIINDCNERAETILDV